MAIHICARRNGAVIDLTNREMIVYGCGSGANRICTNNQWGNIAYALDGDSEKIGTETVLFNRRYKICPPDTLAKLPVDRYWILIASDKYKHEIREMLREKYGQWEEYVFDFPEIFRSYDTIRELVSFDPVGVAKVSNTSISTLLMDYIAVAESLIKRYVRGHVQYSLLSDASRLVCLISENGIAKYVLHFPSRIIGHGGIHDFSARKAIISNIMHLGIPRNSVIYEDEEGFKLSHFSSDAVDFNDNNIIREILSQLDMIHRNSGIMIPVFQDLFETEKHLWEKGFSNSYARKMKDIIHGSIAKILEDEKIPKRVCHGDMHFKNVIIFNGDVELIDLDDMCMGNPFVDISTFLVSLLAYAKNNRICQCSDLLDFYRWIHGGEMTEVEIRQFRAACVFSLYLVYLQHLTWKKYRPDLEDVIDKNLQLLENCK